MSAFFSRRHHVLLLVLLALTVHFGITLLYLTPPNPLKSALGGVINGYMSPWFEQRWELFAPAPASTSRYLLVSCRTRADEVDPPWQDVTAPLLASKYAYRVTPADRLHRAVQACSALVFGERRPLVDKMRSRPEQFKEALSQVEASDEARAEMGRRLIARVASAHCDRIHGPGHTIAVRARVVFRDLPPFSKRGEDDRQGEVKVFDLGWRDYQRVARL